jgi:hypothetical protein
MTEIVAGHTFRVIADGEMCIGEGCQGCRSLTELVARADLIKVGDTGDVHRADARESEINEIKRARDALNARRAVLWG